MKKYLKFVITVFSTAAALLIIVFLAIVGYPKGVFKSSYMSVIADKYRVLQNTNEPKIIVLSGSSSAFGLDQNMLEEATGYKVANLGLHAGTGLLFYTELSKENINEGDIVLLGFEYTWPNNFEKLDQKLIMTGIDNNIDMYKHIPFSYWKDFIGYLFEFAKTKYSYKGASGIYSRSSFDDTGQMIIERHYMIDYPNEKDKWGEVNLTDVHISERVIDYLSDYKEYVEKRGAKVYFIAPPLLKKAVACDYNCFNDLIDEEEEIIGIPYISNPQDYFFEDEYMCNTIYHCSTSGEKVRTKILIEDLKKANIR